MSSFTNSLSSGCCHDVRKCNVWYVPQVNRPSCGCWLHDKKHVVHYWTVFNVVLRKRRCPSGGCRSELVLRFLSFSVIQPHSITTLWLLASWKWLSGRCSNNSVSLGIRKRHSESLATLSQVVELIAHLALLLRRFLAQSNRLRIATSALFSVFR